MSKHTYKERLEAGLKANGFTLEHGGTSKYTTWSKPGHPSKLFVGKAGALRSGPCASQSWSIGDPQSQHSPRCASYRVCLKEGDKALDMAENGLTIKEELALTNNP